MFDKIRARITPEMSDAEVKNIIKENSDDFFSDADILVNKIKNGSNKEKVLDEIKEICENASVFNIVKDYVYRVLKPYEDTLFLRNLKSEEFDKVISYIFNNVILQTEEENVIEVHSHLSKQKISSTTKLLNTLVEWVIAERYTKNKFFQETNDLFGFDKTKIDFFWKLLNDQRSALRDIYLLDNISLCKSIKNDIGELIELLSKIFDPDDEE